MQSDATFSLGMPLNQYSWKGPQGLWEDFLEEYDKNGVPLPKAESLEASAPSLYGEIAYWCGCVYREWHLRNGLWSEEMTQLFPAGGHMDDFGCGHTMSVDAWLESNLEPLIESAKKSREACGGEAGIIEQ